MEHWVADFLSKFTYPAMLALLCAAGMGVPISEDLVLLLGGALAGQEVTSFWGTLAAGYCGVIIGDLLIYQWGRRIGPAAYRHRIVQKALSLERQEKLRVHFAKHGFWTVVVGRHTPVMRAPIFFLSGASGVPLWKFTIADMVSAAITVPVVVLLGYYFGEHLDDVRRWIHKVQYFLVAAVAVLGLAWFLWKRSRRTAGQE